MRILVVHNRYQQAGGEDSVFENEVALLRGGGHEVATLPVSNDAIQGAVAKLTTAALATYNPQGRRLVAGAIARARPDVVHVHNFFPRISPAMFDACAAAGVPAVWTLHNFRVACANGLLFRDGRPCEDCISGSVVSAIRHRCYRGSALGSAAVAGMIAAHRAAGTWQHKVQRFIALTEFSRAKYVAAGLPAARIAVKPNFVDMAPVQGGNRNGALFVGRLSPEKGVRVLVEAWRGVEGVPLTILGDGPDRAELEAVAPANVRFLGHGDRAAVIAAVSSAELLIVPSLWYENFPMTVVEAMALGTPVAASRLGAMTEIVAEGETGMHFTAGDAGSLAATVRAAFADRARLADMGRAARAHYQRRLSPSANLAMLEAIYADALGEMRQAA